VTLLTTTNFDIFKLTPLHCCLHRGYRIIMLRRSSRHVKNAVVDIGGKVPIPTPKTDVVGGPGASSAAEDDESDIEDEGWDDDNDDDEEDKNSEDEDSNYGSGKPTYALLP
jgi:hypothetical protein